MAQTNLTQNIAQDCSWRMACSLCGGKELAPLLELVATPPAMAYVCEAALESSDPCYPLELVMCEACAHVQLAHIVNRFKATGRPVDAVGQCPVAKKHLAAFAADVMARVGESHQPLVVEIGSNDGTLLKSFQDLDWRVQGVESAVNVAGQAIAEGVPTFPGFLMPSTAARIVDERGPAQLVIAHQAFAETESVPGFIAAVRDMLSDDGLFAFEVNALYDLAMQSAINAVDHATLDYHSCAPLRRVLNRTGLELIDVTRIGPDRSRLRGFAQKAGGPRAVQETVEAIIEEDRLAGLSDITTYHTLAGNIARAKHQIGVRLGELKAAGLSIAGYGAAPDSTTLLYSLGLGSDDIEFIIDHSPLRQDRYMPGSHIAIVPPQVLDERQPDWLIMLDWRRADAIIEKCRAEHDASMHFIIPWPELRCR